MEKKSEWKYFFTDNEISSLKAFAAFLILQMESVSALSGKTN